MYTIYVQVRSSRRNSDRRRPIYCGIVESTLAYSDGGTRGRTICRDQVETRQRASDLADGRRPPALGRPTLQSQCATGLKEVSVSPHGATGRGVTSLAGDAAASGPRGLGARVLGSLGRPAAARAAAPPRRPC